MNFYGDAQFDHNGSQVSKFSSFENSRWRTDLHIMLQTQMLQSVAIAYHLHHRGDTVVINRVCVECV